MQIIDAIAEICCQLADGEPKVVSLYHAAVTAAGNKTAQKIINETFDITDGCWRGLGKIKKSTLKLKKNSAVWTLKNNLALNSYPKRTLPAVAAARCSAV